MSMLTSAVKSVIIINRWNYISKKLSLLISIIALLLSTIWSVSHDNRFISGIHIFSNNMFLENKNYIQIIFVLVRKTKLVCKNEISKKSILISTTEFEWQPTEFWYQDKNISYKKIKVKTACHIQWHLVFVHSSCFIYCVTKHTCVSFLLHCTIKTYLYYNDRLRYITSFTPQF